MTDSKSKIVNGAFYLLSIALIVIIGISLKQGFSFLIDYIALFLVLFFVWWIALFLKLKQDNKNRKDRVKNFGDKIRNRR